MKLRTMRKVEKRFAQEFSVKVGYFIDATYKRRRAIEYRRAMERRLDGEMEYYHSKYSK